METLKVKSAAIQDSGTPSEDTLNALKKAIEDANTELALIDEDLTAKKITLSSLTDDINTKSDQVGLLSSEIGKKNEELVKVAQDITDAKAALDILLSNYDSKAKEISLQSSAKEVEVLENLSVKFVIPSFIFNSTTYISKEVEAAIAKEEAWAMELAIELADIKSGVIEVVKKGGK